MSSRKSSVTLNSGRLCCSAQLQQQCGPSDGGDGGCQEEATMNGLDILGAIEISLISRQNSEDATHDTDGGDGRGAKCGKVEWRHWTIRISHHLRRHNYSKLGCVHF